MPGVLRLMSLGALSRSLDSSVFKEIEFEVVRETIVGA